MSNIVSNCLISLKTTQSKFSKASRVLVKEYPFPRCKILAATVSQCQHDDT
ncbi:hypothetical protein Plhal304r1_c007g0027461 [Plasmopara halstedii]